MKNNLPPQLNPMLIERGPPHHLRLQFLIHPLHQLPTQRLDHHRRRYAVCEQIVQLRPHDEDLFGRPLGDDVVRDLSNQHLPVRRRDGGFLCGVGRCGVDHFEHEEGAAEVAA